MVKPLLGICFSCRNCPFDRFGRRVVYHYIPGANSGDLIQQLYGTLYFDGAKTPPSCLERSRRAYCILRSQKDVKCPKYGARGIDVEMSPLAHRGSDAHMNAPLTRNVDDGLEAGKHPSFSDMWDKDKKAT